MYGTIAHVTIKRGCEAGFAAWIRDQELRNDHVPGYVSAYWFKLDRNPREAMLVIIFYSKAAYLANVEDPETDARYQRLLELIEGEPAWHDGEIADQYQRFGSH